MPFDPAQLPQLNANAKTIFHQVAHSAHNLDRKHAADLNALLHDGTLVWQGDADLGHNASNVLQQVATSAHNLDRNHAKAAEAAMAAGTLALVAG